MADDVVAVGSVISELGVFVVTLCIHRSSFFPSLCLEMDSQTETVQYVEKNALTVLVCIHIAYIEDDVGLTVFRCRHFELTERTIWTAYE